MADVLPYGSWPTPITPPASSRRRVGPRRSSVRRRRPLVARGSARRRRPDQPRAPPRRRHGGGRPARPWTCPHRRPRVRRRVVLGRPRRRLFTNWADQRLYRLEPGGEPVAITPEPAEPRGLRYADGVVHPRRALAHLRPRAPRRRRTGRGAQRDRGGCRLDGSARAAASRACSSRARLRVDATVSAATAAAWPGSSGTTRTCRGTAPSCGSATSSGDGTRRRGRRGGPRRVGDAAACGTPTARCSFISDRTGWWNLYRWSAPDDARADGLRWTAEVGGPQWVFGLPVRDLARRRGSLFAYCARRRSTTWPSVARRRRCDDLDLPYRRSRR